MQGNLSIERMCRLGGVSRARFYRCLQERVPVEEDMEVRAAIQQIAVEHRRRYGYRRVTEELKVISADEMFIAIGYGKLSPEDARTVIAPPVQPSTGWLSMIFVPFNTTVRCRAA